MKLAREEALRARRARLMRKHKEFSAFHEITRVIRGDRLHRHVEPTIDIPLVEAIELYNDIEDSTTDASSTIVESDMDHLDRVDSGREEHLVAKRALPTNRSVDRDDPLTLSLHISRVPPKSWQFDQMSLTTELESPVSSVGTFGPQEPSAPREMPHLIESPTGNQCECPSESSDQFSEECEYSRNSVPRPDAAAVAAAAPLSQQCYSARESTRMQFQAHPQLSLPLPPVSSPLWQPPTLRLPTAMLPPQQMVLSPAAPPFTYEYIRTYGAVNPSFVPSPRPLMTRQRLFLAAPPPSVPPAAYDYPYNQYFRPQMAPAPVNPAGLWPVALPAPVPVPAYAHYPVYRAPVQYSFRQPPQNWVRSSNSRQLSLQTPPPQQYDSYSAIYSRERALRDEISPAQPQDTYTGIYLRSKGHMI